MKVAIIGSTGMLGKPVVHAFIEAGYEVSVFVRSARKAKVLFGNSVKYVEGDLKSKNAVASFLTGKQWLYLNLSVKPDSFESEFQAEREGLDHILKFVVERGIDKLGYLSSLVHQYQGMNDFSWWAFDIKKRAIEKIRQTTVKSLIFYPSTFMESFDQGGYRVGNVLYLSGKSEHPLHLISGEDYGRMVVKAFENNDRSRDFIIQGKEGYRVEEAATLMQKLSQNRSIQIKTMSPFALRFLGTFSPKMRYARRIMEALNQYPETFQGAEAWKELGEPRITYKEYCKRSTT